VRERALEDRALLELARALADAARAGAAKCDSRAAAPRVLVNRRLDVALAIGADGAHLGFDAVALADARRLLGEHALLGVSAHDADEIAKAACAGASYAHLAPIFHPLTKAASREPHGIEGLEAAVRAAPRLRVLAQGGIEAHRCGEVVRAGAAGVAVSGAIVAADDAFAATAALREALDAAAARAPQRDG